MQTGENRNISQELRILERYWQEVMGKTDAELADMPDDDFFGISIEQAEDALSNE